MHRIRKKLSALQSSWTYQVGPPTVYYWIAQSHKATSFKYRICRKMQKFCKARNRAPDPESMKQISCIFSAYSKYGRHCFLRMRDSIVNWNPKRLRTHIFLHYTSRNGVHFRRSDICPRPFPCKTCTIQHTFRTAHCDGREMKMNGSVASARYYSQLER